MKEGLGSKAAPKGPKIHASRPGGPCRMGGKPLYQPQLMVLIRSRIESGPPGTRSFLLPEPAPPHAMPGLVRADRRDRRFWSLPTQLKSEKSQTRPPKRQNF